MRKEELDELQYITPIVNVGLVEILARLEQEPYHWPIGRVTFQKITYDIMSLVSVTRLSNGYLTDRRLL
jgi:hypothetical protein